MKNSIKVWLKDVMIVLVIFVLGILTGITLRTKDQIIKIQESVAQETCLNDSTLSIECVKYHLNKHKVKFSHIVLAQAKLESKGLKSSLARTNNNIFGMKVAATRFTFAINSYDYGNYAKYETVEDCITDYKAWQIQNALHITDPDSYFALLKQQYAEDPMYVEKLKKLIR